jgi:3-hydroxyisobutyrate dehydrogenase
MSQVAFIGLGRMGQGMAARLQGSGHALTVYNRHPERAEGLVAAGARLAGSPREAAEGAAAILVMVSDDDASRSTWCGADGVLAADTRPGALAVECSTLSHAWVLELADAATARGLRYLDSPVTGLPDAAASGELTLLIGGQPDDLAAAEPFLLPLATRRMRFGPVGAGTSFKLMVNLMGAVQVAAAAEGMALAERAGLDLHQVADALSTGQAASPQVVRNSRRMADGDHDQDVVFSGLLRRKDTAYALQLAHTLGARVQLGEVALAGLDELVAAGLGELNESSIIDVARRTAT